MANFLRGNSLLHLENQHGERGIVLGNRALPQRLNAVAIGGAELSHGGINQNLATGMVLRAVRVKLLDDFVEVHEKPPAAELVEEGAGFERVRRAVIEKLLRISSEKGQDRPAQVPEPARSVELHRERLELGDDGDEGTRGIDELNVGLHGRIRQRQVDPRHSVGGSHGVRSNSIGRPSVEQVCALHHLAPGLSLARLGRGARSVGGRLGLALGRRWRLQDGGVVVRAARVGARHGRSSLGEGRESPGHI